MVKANIKKRIESLKTGDIITIKNNQVAYSNCGIIQAGDKIKVNNSKTPYVIHIKGKHECFVSGYWLKDGKELPCGIDYENIIILN